MNLLLDGVYKKYETEKKDIQNNTEEKNHPTARGINNGGLIL